MSLGLEARLEAGVEAAITLRDVSASYGAKQAIAGISGCFETGSLTAIAGPNGAGKSTLVKVITGARKASAGRIERSEKRLAYLPQRSAIDQSFPITVADTVLLGHARRAGWHRRLGPVERASAAAALDRVGLTALSDQAISTLSAGQFQRTLFARLIVEDARLLLLDEPFTAIDARTTTDLLALLQDWHEEGRTVVAVLHDFAQMRGHFPQTLLLAREMVAWGPTEGVLTPDNLARAATLAQSWDDDLSVPHNHAVRI